MSERRQEPFAKVVDSDVVVVGAGVAGLSAALGLSGRRVTLLSKMPFSATGAGYCTPTATPDRKSVV